MGVNLTRDKTQIKIYEGVFSFTTEDRLGYLASRRKKRETISWAARKSDPTNRRICIS